MLYFFDLRKDLRILWEQFWNVFYYDSLIVLGGASALDET